MIDTMIAIGAKGKSEMTVTPERTAKSVGSGSLEVFATPMLAALMENAAVRVLQLPEGQSSVGTYLEIKHTAASPVGIKVWAEAEVIQIDGRKIVFSIQAFDEQELIGEAKHERVIINTEKFMAKSNAKKAVDPNG